MTSKLLHLACLLHLCALGFAQSTLHRFDGAAPNARLGRVAAAGDVDGDGRPDVVVGEHTPQLDGAVRVYSGATGEVLHAFFGDAAGDQFGDSVAGAGDVDGDGFDDVIVGAPFADGPGGLSSGLARVFSGATGLELYTFRGEGPSDFFGSDVSGAGDLDGDHRQDLVVGAVGALAQTGRVYAFSGFDGSLLLRVDGANGDNLGSAVSALGDVDGDGRDDLLVGAPGAGFADPGRAVVLSGVTGDELYEVTNGAPVSFFGFSAADLGDVDGDLVPDFVVGDFDLERVYVYSGAAGALLFDIPAVQQGNFGASVDGAGDVDADGVGDVLVGANSAAGGFGSVTLISGATGRVLLHFNGDDQGDALGDEVAGVGDVNGDARDDFAASAPGNDAGGVDSGSAFVYSLTVPATRIDFELAESGAPLANGQPLDAGTRLGGIARVHGLGAANFGAALFDSDPFGPNRFGPDPDLLVDRGNLLILQEDPAQAGGLFIVPDDAAQGGELVIELLPFAHPVSLELVDICPGLPPQDAVVTLFDEEGRTRTYDVPGGWTGDITVGRDPGVGTLSLETLDPQPGVSATATVSQHTRFDAEHVTRIEIAFAGSAAVDDLVVFPGSLDEPSDLFEVVGTVGDALGIAVAPAGDLDLDGVPDVIVGASDASFAGNAVGSAHVYSGADGVSLLRFDGSSQFSEFGVAVDGLGDVDRDGFPDYVIGAPSDESTGERLGRVEVRSGATGGILWARNGASFFGDFGRSVARVADLTGDGASEVVVGAPREPGTVAVAGRASVYSGADGALLFTFLGDDSGARFGRSVANVGDVDGDGVEDIAVGAPLADPLAAGRVTVFSGATRAALFSVGGRPGDVLGDAVAAAGDVNGDGFGDVIVGAPGSDTFAPDGGYARVYAGPSGSILFTFPGSVPQARAGSAVAGAGDVNGDGSLDLLVGLPELSAVGLIEAGAVEIYSGDTGERIAILFGDDFFGEFGRAVAGVGDLSGDGFAEVLIGAPEEDAGGSGSGRAVAVTFDRRPQDTR